MSIKIKTITHVLVDRLGRPQYACSSIAGCISTYADLYCQGAIILNNDSRDRLFAKLVKDGWSIQAAYAHVTVSHIPITIDAVQAEK